VRRQETLERFGTCHEMDFSNSTFTVEVSGVAAVAFQAKWHSEAEGVCQAWVQRHWDQLRTNGRHGSELPAVVRLRLAHADEKVSYDLASGEGENYDGVKVINLVDVNDRPWAHFNHPESDDGELHGLNESQSNEADTQQSHAKASHS
jgi:hypothetical protein